MKIDLPGLLIEKLPSGNFRCRVRVRGNKSRRIRLFIDPSHKDFLDHYHAARAGIVVQPENSPAENAVPHSIAWLSYKYLDDLEKRVTAGLASKITLKKKMLLMAALREDCGEYSMSIPSKEIIRIRDSMADRPAWADSMVVAMRGMFTWAIERGLCQINPAVGISRIDRGKGGAIAWTVDDLKKYRDHHPPGTMAHLCLTIFMFTACRISDAVVLGRGNEFERSKVRGIGWQPKKKNSAPVEIPMLDPLYKATRATSVIGPTYLLTGKGIPYCSPDALGQRFRKWCRQAGLENRSSHGIRKAAGHLLAQEGCSQYQIMAIHGHTEAATSEIYTKGANRWDLATEAMKKMEKIEW